jgi:hypothetical protein
VRRALARLDVDLLVLKGGAYIAQDLECAAGRLPADLDIMVERRDLERAQRALVEAGWRSMKLGTYDTRYYERWTHQAPPLRAPGHIVEVDLHHAILPPRGARANPAELWKRSVEIGARLRVLAPIDQVVHAVAHLFVDSDCTHRLRDLVDIAQLMDQFGRGSSARFFALLRSRAHELGVGAALDDACAFASEWLGVDVDARETARRPRAARALIARRLAPPDPDALPPCIDPAHALLAARALVLRLPWHRALVHAMSRPLRRILAA